MTMAKKIDYGIQGAAAMIESLAELPEARTVVLAQGGGPSTLDQFKSAETLHIPSDWYTSEILQKDS